VAPILILLIVLFGTGIILILSAFAAEEVEAGKCPTPYDHPRP
jgi:hypothetical protein